MPLTKVIQPMLDASFATATNRIINGKFAIDQRIAFGGANVTAPAGLYVMDRWIAYVNTTGILNVAGVVDPLYGGERRGRLWVSTADATLSSSEYCLFRQILEGYNIADLNFGTAQAQPFTLACEMESSIAATLPVSFGNGVRQYTTTVTLAANTRTLVVITVPGDTGGTWAATSALGMTVTIGLGVGSNYVAPTANVWAAGNYLTVAGATNFMATLNALLYLRNVRLYKGSVDLGPDQRLYAEELALCQRYYQKSYNADVVPGTAGAAGNLASYSFSANLFMMSAPLPTPMRAGPTATLYSGQTGAAGMIHNEGAGTNVAGSIFAGEKTFVVLATFAGANQKGNFHYALNAEL